MENSESLTGAASIAQTMSKIASYAGPIQNILYAHRELHDKLRPLKLHETFARHDTMSAIFKANDITRFHTLSQSITKQLATVFPPGTLTAMQSISRQHEELFKGIRGVSQIFESHPALTQLNSMQAAMSGIAGRIAAIAATNRNWELIDEFENISEQAIALTENLSGDIALTPEEQTAFDSLIDFVVAIVKKNRKFGIYSLLFIDMVLRVASFHQYYDFLKTKPELATKEDFSRFQNKLIKSVEEKLKAEKEYRITNRLCKVHLKPKIKSLTLNKLPAGFEVVILEIRHKWVYATYFDPIDQVAQSGWIQKKYLARP